jgi:hypothetical protein
VVLRYPNTATRDAFNGSRNAGDISFTTGNTWYEQWTGAKWMPCTPIQSIKTANQSVNNSVALVNATGLVVPLPAASTSYRIDAWIPYNSSTVADIKLGFTAPALATYKFAGPGLAFNAASNIGDGEFGFASTAGTITFGGSGGDVAFRLVGTVITGVATGNLQLQFAQGFVEVSNTTILADAWLKAEAIS